MIENGKIANRQAMLLLVSGILSTGILIFPTLTTAAANQDAWLSVVFAAGLGLITVLIMIALGRRFPDQTIVEYSEDLLGKLLGKAAGAVLIWYFLYLTAIATREFGEFITTAFMEDTPPSVFVFTILSVAALAIYSGLEVIGRVNEFMLSLTIFSFFLFIFLAVSQMDPARLTPVLSDGLGPVIKGAIPASGWFGELIVLGFILPYINRPALAKRSAIMAVLILLIIQITAVAASIMTFGPAQTGRMQFPAFMITRNISIMGIVERNEAIFIVLWVAGVFVKIMVYYYVIVLATSQWLQLRSYRPLILPLGTVVGALAFLSFNNIAELMGFLSNVWGWYALPLELGLPALLLAVALIRAKGRWKR
jgi:spore germination protein KB